MWENDIFVDSVYVPKGKAPRQILTGICEEKNKLEQKFLFSPKRVLSLVKVRLMKKVLAAQDLLSEKVAENGSYYSNENPPANQHSVLGDCVDIIHIKKLGLISCRKGHGPPAAGRVL